MRIFGLNILTNKQLDDLKDEYIKEAFNCYWHHFEQIGIFQNLNVLKKTIGTKMLLID